MLENVLDQSVFEKRGGGVLINQNYMSIIVADFQLKIEMTESLLACLPYYSIGCNCVLFHTICLDMMSIIGFIFDFIQILLGQGENVL